jgi:hypothetical protein
MVSCLRFGILKKATFTDIPTIRIRFPSRPLPGLQPATRTVAGFRLPSVGPPCISKLLLRHRVAPVFVYLRPSATVAAWHPGPAAPFRGKASVRLVCGSLASVRLSRNSLPATSAAPPAPGITHARGAEETPQRSCILTGSQPLLALLATLSVCQGKCRTDSGETAAPHTFLPHPSASTGPAAFLAKPDHASFFAAPGHCQGEQPPQPTRRPAVAAGERRAPKHFCQYAGPSDNRALCKVAASCRLCRVYSPLSLRLRLHNAGDYPTCQPVAAIPGRFTLRDRLCRL